jgi:hypothetical protein
VNGTVKELSVPARIINNKTMIPVRFVSEAFNKDVEWSNPERTIYIKDKISDTTTESTTQAVQTNTEVSIQTTTQAAEQSTQTTTQTDAQQSNTFDQNIMYDAVNKTLILKNTNSSFTVDEKNVEYSDDDKTMKIQFESSVGDSIKNGIYTVGTNGVSSINYAVENGKTTVTIKSDSKLEASVEMDKTYVYITLK